MAEKAGSIDKGYWKLLVDRKMVDQTNKSIIEQKAVKPVFGLDAIKGTINDAITSQATQDFQTAVQTVCADILDGNLNLSEETKRDVERMEMNEFFMQIEQMRQDQMAKDKVESVLGNGALDNLVGRRSERVTDARTLNDLNEQLRNGDVTTVYRAMQLVYVDGKKMLVPPMAGQVKITDENGKTKWVWQNPSEIGVWEKSTEITNFDEAVANGTLKPTTYKDGRPGYTFALRKGTKKESGKSFKDVPAAYNPYIHTSLSTLNDQFTSAYERPNLVIVKGYVPNSEVNARPGEILYQAEYAKDPVGKTHWHSGVVAAQMPETREVILSRYFMPVEVMENSEVAAKIKDQMQGRDIEIPYNVVSPGLRRELEKVGVRIGEGQGLSNLPAKDSVRYADRGTAKDGRKMYEGNFPKGTPKSAKSERILSFIQNVWSKNPITLIISNGEKSRKISARFDPTFDGADGNKTDASKIAGGNRHGNHTEQRVTLDLADDYYQIASEAKYNYSKMETGKETKTHSGVKMWHYFIDEIYFAEYGSNSYEPYTVTVNVKEKDDGEYVYSFNAEKEFSTQQTLHAAVSTYKGTNGELFIKNSLSQPSPDFKTESNNNGRKSNNNGRKSDRPNQNRSAEETVPTSSAEYTQMLARNRDRRALEEQRERVRQRQERIQMEIRRQFETGKEAHYDQEHTRDIASEIQRRFGPRKNGKNVVSTSQIIDYIRSIYSAQTDEFRKAREEGYSISNARDRGYTAARNAAEACAEAIVTGNGEFAAYRENYKKAREILKGKRVYISPDVQKELEYVYGSFKEARNAAFRNGFYSDP